MRKAPTLFVVVLMQALVACKSTESPGLEGTWRLTNRQCECAPAPVPDETVTFTATQFTFYSGNRALRFGEYTLAIAAVPCFNNGSMGPAVQFTYSPTNNLILTPSNVQYRLDGNTLTLDYGGPCDAPVDTYVRL